MCSYNVKRVMRGKTTRGGPRMRRSEFLRSFCVSGFNTSQKHLQSSDSLIAFSYVRTFISADHVHQSFSLFSWTYIHTYTYILIDTYLRMTFINGYLIATCFSPDLTDDRGVHLVMSQLLAELDSVVNLLMRCFPSELLRRDES